jgi:hypothetical protein
MDGWVLSWFAGSFQLFDLQQGFEEEAIFHGVIEPEEAFDSVSELLEVFLGGEHNSSGGWITPGKGGRGLKFRVYLPVEGREWQIKRVSRAASGLGRRERTTGS